MTETPRRKHKRPRPQSSCSTCHRRKVKCDQSLPCRPCVRHGCAEFCRYDGIPVCSENTRIPPAPSNSSEDQDPLRNGSNVPTRSKGSKAELTTAGRSMALLDKTYSQPGTRFQTHDLPKDGQRRGRTHSSGILRLMDPVMVYVGQDTLSENFVPDDKITANIKKTELKSASDMLSTSVYNEIPPMEVACNLVWCYFETWDTVFPLIDREEFDPKFQDMLADPSSVTICFVIRTLVVQALANATYPLEEAPISAGTVRRWLNLASSVPVSALEFGEVHRDSLMMFSLVALADQVLTQDPTSAYVKSGSSVRAAMTLGMHLGEDGVDESSNYLDDQSLWRTIIDVDLHACLATGMPPSVPLSQDAKTPLNYAQDHDFLNELEQRRLRTVLLRSLPIRQKILAALNCEKHLKFEQVVELSSELTRAFAPLSTRTDVSAGLKTFQYKYIAFVYGRFLSALHRPFATLGDPAFYLSRSMAVRLSKQYLREVCAVYHGRGKSDSFASLLTGNGIMFRTEARQALMVCCYELVRDDNDLSMGLSGDESRAAVIETVAEFLEIAKKQVKRNEMPKRFHLLPAMALARLNAQLRFGQGSSEYEQAMMESGRAAERFSAPTSEI